MSFQEEIYYKIEAYLGGELDAEEMAAFENEISSNDLLKAEVEKHKVANALIMQQRLLSVKNILQEERLKDSGPDRSYKPFGFILIAAVAIGIGTSVWMLNDDVRASSDKGAESSIVSGMEKSEHGVSEEAKMNALKKASKQHVPVEDVGFHKQQIQEIEEHLRVDEKGSLYVDTTSGVKKGESPIAGIPDMKNAGEQTTIAANPCSGVSIQATVRATSTCSSEATGTILVSKIQGGTKPYTITILDSHKESIENGLLQAAVYNVYITDANACETTYSNVQVTEKECSVDYSFNPFMGEKWMIESYKVQGVLEIYNKGGVLYFKKNLDANTSNEWTGMGFNNQIIPGYYIFVIRYVDGTTKKGSVTIVQ